MKISIKYISILSLVFLFLSCDDFLIRGPIDQLGEPDFYKNTEEVNQGVMACYNGMQACANAEFYLTEIRSDNTRGNTATSQSLTDLFFIDIYNMSASNPYVNTYWEAVYHNISRCNKAISYLGVVENDSTKKQYEGEALFIRAYHYFNLVRLFGPVFKVTENITYQQAAKYERSSVNDIYTLITDDLEKIVDSTDPLLPSTYPSTEKGRIDVWAAKALLAKVYLTLGEYDKVKTLLTDVKDNSGYKLLSTYASVFDTGNEMNDEILFTIRYKAGGYGLGSPFANLFAPSSSYTAVITGGGDGRNTPTEDLVSAYESADTRKAASYSYTWTNPNGATEHTSYVTKFYSQVATKYDAENDWPILRFSDVLLMLGEVENELSGPSAGLPYLNQIRNRAGLLSLTTETISNKVLFRLAMEKERRLEFAFENQRFFDLLRTDRIVEVMKNHFLTEVIRSNSTAALTSYYQNPSYTYTYKPDPIIPTNKLILPIPSKVLEQSTLATQNPGY